MKALILQALPLTRHARPARRQGLSAVLQPASHVPAILKSSHPCATLPSDVRQEDLACMGDCEAAMVSPPCRLQNGPMLWLEGFVPTIMPARPRVLVCT